METKKVLALFAVVFVLGVVMTGTVSAVVCSYGIGLQGSDWPNWMYKYFFWPFVDWVEGDIPLICYGREA